MTLTFMDERNKSDIIINSLPVSRKDIIIAEYISCAIFIIGHALYDVSCFLIRALRLLVISVYIIPLYTLKFRGMK